MVPLVFQAREGCAWAGLLSVPVGGGPPASRPRRELRSARRLEARPGPATAHGHRSLALPPVPSGSSGALHTSGTWCAGVWPGQAPPPTVTESGSSLEVLSQSFRYFAP